MNIVLNEKQKCLREDALEWCRKELLPLVKEYDAAPPDKFPMDLYQKARKQGYFTFGIDKRYGGGGNSNFDTALLYEVLGYFDGGFATGVGVNMLGTFPIFLSGNEEMAQVAADRLKNGKYGMAAFALTERNAGSDSGAQETTAVKDGTDWIINGEKNFVTNGEFAEIFSVFATTDSSLGNKGIAAFTIEGDRPGIHVLSREDKMGTRLSAQVEIKFDNIRIPAKNMIAEPGKGMQLSQKTLLRTRGLGSASSVGIAQRAIDESLKWAHARQAFGKPIIHNQGLQFMLADMEIQTQAARQLVYNFTRLLDEKITDEILSSTTKTFASDTAMRVTTDAVQIFGGYGYSRNYPVEKLMRDAKTYQIFEGTNQIQRIVIAGQMMSQFKRQTYSLIDYSQP